MQTTSKANRTVKPKSVWSVLRRLVESSTIIATLLGKTIILRIGKPDERRFEKEINGVRFLDASPYARATFTTGKQSPKAVLIASRIWSFFAPFIIE